MIMLPWIDPNVAPGCPEFLHRAPLEGGRGGGWGGSPQRWSRFAGWRLRCDALGFALWIASELCVVVAECVHWKGEFVAGGGGVGGCSFVGESGIPVPLLTVSQATPLH